jgi:outer membrane protein TolC
MGGSRTDFLSLMVGVNIPLYAAAKQSSAISQKTSEFEKSRYEVLEHKRKIMASISSAVADYERAKEQRALFEDGILPQARQTVQSMLAAYQVSQVDFLNLVRAQVTLFNYELDYWKTLTEAKQSLSKIQAAVGEESIYE